jgi:hypothetical protein
LPGLGDALFQDVALALKRRCPLRPLLDRDEVLGGVDAGVDAEGLDLGGGCLDVGG